MMNLKKLGALAVVSTLVLTGCGKKTVTCTQKSTEDGAKYTAEIVGYLKSGKIDSVKLSMNFEDEETAKQYCSLMSLATVADDGTKVEFKCDGKKIIISNYEKLAGDSSVIGKTKDEFISEMKKSGGDQVTCK